MFEAVVGTNEGQIAVASGTLRRTWTQEGRRYFHYATDAPILNSYAFFSAAYAVRDVRWNDVEIQIFHHPAHASNVDRMVRSVQASLEHLTKWLGPYPHRQIKLVEHPGGRRTLFSNPTNIQYQEGFSFINPVDDPRGIDLPSAVVAHEMAHQWWGNRLVPALVVGAPVLNESLAWYSALEVVEAVHGPEHRDRLLGAMLASYLSPRARRHTAIAGHRPLPVVPQGRARAARAARVRRGRAGERRAAPLLRETRLRDSPSADDARPLQ